MPSDLNVPSPLGSRGNLHPNGRHSGVPGDQLPFLHRIFLLGKLRSYPILQDTFNADPLELVADPFPCLTISISRFSSVIGAQSLL